MKKRFSIKTRLMLTFGFLLIAAIALVAQVAVRRARAVAIEQIKTYFTEKTVDAAKIFDERLMGLTRIVEGLASMPMFRDETLSDEQKAEYLQREVDYNTVIAKADISTAEGIQLRVGKKPRDVKGKPWYEDAMRGNIFIRVIYSETTHNMMADICVPVYNDSKKIIGVIKASTGIEDLINDITDIRAGKTGFCFIVDNTGVLVIHPDKSLIDNEYNLIEAGEKDPAVRELSTYVKNSLRSEKNTAGLYMYKNKRHIAGAAVLNTTGWTLFIHAPVEEFLENINKMRVDIIVIAGSMLCIFLLAVALMLRRAIKPICATVTALQNISQGEGDLTVRLPLIGNDEMTDLADYFNRTY